MAKAGRKAKGNYASKGATISARLTVNTRRRLDDAAKASGNSLSAEIERRLIASFEKDEVYGISTFGHPQTYALLRLAAEAVKQVEGLTGAKWYQNRFTHDATTDAVMTILAAFRPPGNKRAPVSFPMNPALDAWPESKRAVRKATEKRRVGVAAAKTPIASMQAAPGITAEEFKGYRQIGDKLLRRLGKPVLPLPKSDEEKSRDLQIIGRVPEEK